MLRSVLRSKRQKPTPAAPADESLQALLSAAIDRLQHSSSPDAKALVEECEALRDEQLDLAVEEFILRRRRGESISASVFAARFPSISRSLEAQIVGEEWVESEFAAQSGARTKNASDTTPETEISAGEWPQPGERFLDYTVVKRLAVGGGSQVFLCRAESLGGRLEVVKISRGRESVEAQTAGPLAHPHIMPVLGAAKDARGRSVLAMPYVARATLGFLLELLVPSANGGGAEHPPGDLVLAVLRDCNAGLAPNGDDGAIHYDAENSRTAQAFANGYEAGVVAILLGVAEALSFAHRRQVLHLDLKPSNILIGAGGHPWLLDFDKARDRRLGKGSLGGTLPYMPPEQLDACRIARGDDAADSLDERCDVFSFGVVLYELLTGKLPFVDCRKAIDWDRETAERYREAQRAGRRLDTPLRAAPAVVRLIDDCLRFDPRERPASTELTARLTAIHQAFADKARRRTRRQWLASGASLAASVGFASLGLRIWRRANELPSDGGFAQAKAKLKSGDLDGALARCDRGVEAIEEPILQAKLLSARARVREQLYRRDAAYRGVDFAAETHLAHAVVDLHEANRLAPNAQRQALIGYYYDLRREDQLAIQHYHAADRSWRSAALLHNLGRCYARRRDNDRATTFFISALDVDGRLEPALRHLAEIEWQRANDLRRRGLEADFSSAIAHIETALRIGPLTGELLVLAAKIHASASQLDGSQLDGNHRPRAIALLNQAEVYGASPRILAGFRRGLGVAPNPSATLVASQSAPGGPYDAVETLDPLPEFLPS